jgi:DNA ligase (NAD+)
VASKKICEAFGNDWYRVEPERFLELEGFGPEMVRSIAEFVEVNRDKIEKLLEILQPKEPEKEEPKETPLAGLRVVITGVMRLPRSKIKELLERAGAQVSSSVSKKTDIVFYGEDPGGKLQKAKELGVRTLPEEKMWEMLGEA